MKPWRKQNYTLVAFRLKAPNSPMQGEAPQIAADLSDV
jgi:hypothetical protein